MIPRADPVPLNAMLRVRVHNLKRVYGFVFLKAQVPPAAPLFELGVGTYYGNWTVKYPVRKLTMNCKIGVLAPLLRVFQLTGMVPFL